MPGAQERLCELREEAYCKVLKCFVASQSYDLKKELMLAQLRTELKISDERHEELRQCISNGEERPWIKGRAQSVVGISSDSEPPSPAMGCRDPYGAPQGGSPFGQAGQKRSSFPGAAPKPAKKRLKKGSAEPDGHQQAVHVPPAGIAGGPVMGMNPLVGHKVDRYWAEDHKWWSGIITDYNGISGEHCIVYDAGTSAESYEWLTVNSCSPDELRILDEKVNVLEIPKPPSAQGDTGDARGLYQGSDPKRGGGGGGGRKSGMGGGGRGLHKGGRPVFGGQEPSGYPQQTYLAQQAARQFEAISSGDDDYD
ncbi:Protein EMSY-LIKE 3 [Coccomyxa sp. Obi]|nr:Protein EMSY-LIKE 3 [Coccomyxa sp. Obi]